MKMKVPGAYSEMTTVSAVIGDQGILVGRESLSKLLSENKHLELQVKELQINGNLQSEQLRAYRRLALSKEQLEILKKDLEDTTKRVLDSYGMELPYDIPLPVATEEAWRTAVRAAQKSHA